MYEPAHAAAQVEPAPPYQPDRVAEPEPDRPGLGTTFGESVYAPISFAPFTRASAARPGSTSIGSTDYIWISEPWPFGVLMPSQVPFGTYFQACAL